MVRANRAGALKYMFDCEARCEASQNRADLLLSFESARISSSDRPSAFDTFTVFGFKSI